jgi:nitrate/nitrite transporter NarK
MTLPPTFFQLSFDAWTMIVAIVVVGLTSLIRLLRGIRPIVTKEKATTDFLNGSVVVPFLVLIFSVFDTNLLDWIQSAKVTLGLSGGVGFIFVSGELLRSCSFEHASPKKAGGNTASPE